MALLNDQGLRRLARVVYSDDLATTDDPHPSLLAVDLADYPRNLIDVTQWAITEKRYQHIRWWVHWSRVYHVPPRKLRKCQLRRTELHKKRERRRYL